MSERVWLCLEALAASLDDDGHANEEIIDQLEKEMRSFSPARYLRAREHLTVAIAQLSRLAMRVRQSDPQR